MEIRCPSDCHYLAASREHPPAVIGRQRARDLEVLAAALRDLTPAEADLAFRAMALMSAHRHDGFLRSTDADVAEAAASVAATLETAARGVIFEHRPATVAAERLARSLRGLQAADEARRPGFESNLASALRKVEQLARGARETLPGGETACLDLIERVTRQLGPPAEVESRPGDEPRIVVP
ncbi:MAG: hypothetical protein ACE148_06070 [Vicinamibacterales bacterium]